jgi:S-formylglutathione hydrolase FrmB
MSYTIQITIIDEWFTPDPANQFANPYLAMGNNPVMYVDPNGEFVFKFIGTKVAAVYDFFKTGLTDGGFEFWNWGSDNFNDTWRNFDPTAEWSTTNKALRIDLGLFKTDKDKEPVGRAWQFVKRHTWQKATTILGNLNSPLRGI